MRKTLSALLGTLFLLTLCCCSPKQEYKLLENADISQNSLALFCFDGEQTTIKYVFNREEERIISEINKLNARQVDLDNIPDLKIPCFGLEIGDISLTYSNGYWLDKNGKVYKANYDFKNAYIKAESDEPIISSGGLLMPNSWYLGAKDVRFYQKSKYMKNVKAGLSISFVSYEDNIATVNLKNTAHIDGTVGEYFTLQKKIDGEWYTIPPKEPMVFHAVGYSLQEGQDIDMKCHLNAYGDLQKGQYRIEMEGIVCEFEI